MDGPWLVPRRCSLPCSPAQILAQGQPGSGRRSPLASLAVAGPTWSSSCHAMAAVKASLLRLDPVKGPLNPSFSPTAASRPPSSPSLSYLLSSAFSIWKMRWRPRWCGRPRRTAWWQGWRLRWLPGPASRQRSRAVIPGRFSEIRPMWPASRCTVCLQTRLSFWQGEYRLWRGSARRADGQRAGHGRTDAQEARPSVQVRAHGNLTLALTSSPPPPPAAPWPRPAAAPARRVLHQQPPVQPQRQASRQLQQDEAA